MSKHFPMPPRRQPALLARLRRSGGQNDSGNSGNSGPPLTPADFEACAAQLDTCAQALRTAADTWRASADPESASARMRAEFAIYANVLDAAEALNSIAQKGAKG